MKPRQNLETTALNPEQNDSASSHVSEGEFEQILYRVTHDLHGCLRAIRTIPEWIEDELAEAGTQMPAPAKDLFVMLRTQARRGDRMLHDLRDYLQVARGGDPVTWLSLSSVLDAAAECAALPPAFTVTTALARDRVFGASSDMVALFAALLSNAVKHHDRTQGQIRITSQEAGKGLRVRVGDDGPGIAPQFRERVFELMTTLKPRDECEGSGVGLALARKIVTHMGGAIRIIDAPGDRGTTVELLLPAAGSGPAPA
ncbi:MAG: HAMP domain-containing histidine kinase [Gammaproteobacteria bacterium]|nr:HAMP domain-containing histidine kinase [Gammaproteobacteria bacterium]